MAAKTTTKNVIIAKNQLRVFENDLHDDVAGVSTTVDHFFEQFVKIPQENDVLGRIIAMIKIAQQFQLKLVRIALDRLQTRVHFAGGVNVGSFAQLPHHRQHHLGRLIEQLDLPAKIVPVQIFRTNQNPLPNFLNRLRDL